MSSSIHKEKFRLRLLHLVIIVGLGSVGFMLGPKLTSQNERTFLVRAFRYGYEPNIIRVNKGDTIHLRLVSADVVHGFYLEGYDLDAAIVPMRSTFDVRHPSRGGPPQSVEEVVFKADREGKFRYRCSQTCGFLHPFMLGEFIVGPNRLLPTSMGLALGCLFGWLIVALLTREEGT